MAAKIIGKFHDVTCYTVNGRKRFIVEQVKSTFNLRWVNRTIAHLQSRKWEDVYNWLDAEIERNGGTWEDFPGLDKTVERLTV